MLPDLAAPLDPQQYQRQLAGLILLCIVLAAWQPASKRRYVVETSVGADGAPRELLRDYNDAQRAFYAVYALVMAADWLQGPYLFSLYRQELALAGSVVAALYVAGFVAGAVSAYFVGAVADRVGRRAACCGFCVVYCVANLVTVGARSVPLLFVGRALGGVSTSLLFSVFESWMVADFHARGLAHKGLDLSQTFGTMGQLNSIAAILSGIFGDWVVARTGTMKTPFLVSSGLLAVALGWITMAWDENYGQTTSSSSVKDTSNPPKNTLGAILGNKQLLALGLASTMFEGSMYLFVYFWTPTLKAAHATASALPDNDKTPPPSSDLPYGIVFSSFMAAMMVASLAFNSVMARGWLSHAQLLTGLMVAACAVFAVLAAPRTERATFWLFCAFEACVGAYWPTMGYLKGQLIDDAVRARVYGVLRVPLNIFVVLSLLVTRDGHGGGQGVFAVCGLLLLGSATMLATAGLGRPKVGAAVEATDTKAQK